MSIAVVTGSAGLVGSECCRRFNIPRMALDYRLAEAIWSWRPATRMPKILEEIAAHAESNPGWIGECA